MNLEPSCFWKYRAIPQNFLGYFSISQVFATIFVSDTHFYHILSHVHRKRTDLSLFTVSEIQYLCYCHYILITATLQPVSYLLSAGFPFYSSSEYWSFLLLIKLLFFFLNFLAEPRGLQDLNSPTGDGTWAPFSQLKKKFPNYKGGKSL